MQTQNVKDMIKYVRSILEENVNSVPLEGVTDVGTISINTVIENVLCKSIESVVKVAPMELFSNPNVFPTSISLKGWSGSGTPSEVFTHVGSSGASAPYVYNSTGKIIGKIITETTTLKFKLLNGTEYTGYTASGHNMDSPTLVLFGSARNGGYMYKPEDYLRTLFIEASGWERPVVDLTPLSSPFVSIARSEINISVGNSEKPLAVDSFQDGMGVIELYPATTGDNVNIVYVEQPKITGTTLANKTVNCDGGSIYHAACYYAAYQVAMIKGYANAENYKNAALDSLNVPIKNVNATSGAEVQQ